jgi:Transcriptional Coactivator p15 (PC4)
MRDVKQEADMDDHVLAEVRKNLLDVLRVVRRQYRGHVFIDIRTYYQDAAGTWQPTKKGITVSPDLWNDFMQALRQVEVQD